MSKTVKFNWKRSGIFWGLVLIGAAVMLILNGIGVDLGYEISVWRIILGVLCLAWLVDSIVEGEFAELPFPLAFMFLIFEPTIAHAIGHNGDDLISNWTVLLAALLLTIGLHIVLPDKKGKSVKLSGSTTLYFDASDLSNAHIHDNLGSVHAYVTNCEAYQGNGCIRISDNLGKVVLHVPSNWNVSVEASDNLGVINSPEPKDGVYDNSLSVIVTDNLGSVSIVND
ncbi:MAG: hypothetical protein IJT70_08145 [Clostridia bacterium]|nr:hypothetical protein [Clostridia bacterium]